MKNTIQDGGSKARETAVFHYELREWREWAAGGFFTTEGTENTEENREEGLEEIAWRYNLQPVGGFPPEVRERWPGWLRVSKIVNGVFWTVGMGRAREVGGETGDHRLETVDGQSGVSGLWSTVCRLQSRYSLVYSL